MYKFFVIILSLFIFNYTKAQVVPIGTIIKTNKLPDIEFNPSTSSIINNETVIICSARFIEKGSKAPIIEKGFLVRTNINSTIPLTIENSRKFGVTSGSSNFYFELMITPQNFPNFNYSNTYNTIEYRAYAINSFGQVIYANDTGSDIVALNPCSISPCKNGAGCINYGGGLFFCDCTPAYCGDCCARPIDPSCTSGENSCDAFYQNLAYDNTKIKYFNNLIKPNLKQKTSIWQLSISNSTIIDKQKIFNTISDLPEKHIK